MKKLNLIIIAFFSCINCYAQLTQNDFKLSLDNHYVGDNSLSHRITKEKLLKSKKLIPNFGWAKIKSFTVYFSPGCNNVNSCKGDLICKEIVSYFEMLTPNSVVSFEAIVVNKQGKEVPFTGFSLIITNEL